MRRPRAGFFGVFERVFRVDFRGRGMETAVAMTVSASSPGSARERTAAVAVLASLTNPLSAPTEAKVRKVMRMATHRAFSVP